jgi:hypothetical protein
VADLAWGGGQNRTAGGQSHPLPPLAMGLPRLTIVARFQQLRESKLNRSVNGRMHATCLSQ